MLEIKNVSLSYGEALALEEINLTVGPGEICIFVGPSGCGKSSLLEAVAGLNPNFQGSISWNGEAIRPKRHVIGWVPQNYGLLPWKTVYKNITLGLEIRDKEVRSFQKADSILSQLKIQDLKNRYPKELSGGERQRVALARAFVLEPDLLLMDEPFSALDAMTREATQELFFNLWKGKKRTTLFVTHDISEAVFLGTKIVLLSPSPGRILNVLDNPLAEAENRRDSEEALHLIQEIRNQMREEWK